MSRGLARRNQRRSDAGVQPHLVVDDLSTAVKLLCMGPFALLKESADQSLEHVERLIDQSCRELQHDGGECCLTAKRFELG